MNKSFIYLLSFSLLFVFAFSSCSKISLTKVEKKEEVIKGEWSIDFTVNEEILNSSVEFNQSGSQITGEGVDLATGKRFTIQQGSVSGDQIKFQKKYITADPSQQPIQYIGKLEYLSIPEYKGWAMSGNYSTVVSGQPISGNWEATPKAATAQSQAPAPVAQAPSPEVHNNPPVEQNNETTGNASGNGEKGPDLSGRYDVSYAFDFKTVHSKMWLEQDGNNLLGHGVDTNTNEKFTIEKGWYHFPNVTIIRKYIKGKDAASTRTVIFKATVSVNSHGPHLKGQTQYGGDWQAQIIR